MGKRSGRVIDSPMSRYYMATADADRGYFGAWGTRLLNAAMLISAGHHGEAPRNFRILGLPVLEIRRTNPLFRRDAMDFIRCGVHLEKLKLRVHLLRAEAEIFLALKGTR